MAKKILLIFIILLISLLGGEIILRLMGYKTDYYANSPITRRYIEMNHKRYFYPDSLLGWKLAPGHYYLPLENNKYSEAMHSDMGFRITSGTPRSHPDSAAKVFILGCSFTYGVYMGDSESLAFRLQDSLPYMHVYDMGVPAYGDIQSLISLRQMINSGFKPGFVILDYSSIHDERNVFSREWQKKLSHERLSFIGISVPYGSMGNGRLEIKYGKLDYSALPLTKYSVLMNLADNICDRIIDNPTQASEVSYQTILAIAQICREVHAHFILAGIDSDGGTIAMLKKCNKKNIEIINLNDGCPTCSNPPDAKTHAIYAQKLFRAICRAQ